VPHKNVRRRSLRRKSKRPSGKKPPPKKYFGPVVPPKMQAVIRSRHHLRDRPTRQYLTLLRDRLYADELKRADIRRERYFAVRLALRNTCQCTKVLFDEVLLLLGAKYRLYQGCWPLWYYRIKSRQDIHQTSCYYRIRKALSSRR